MKIFIRPRERFFFFTHLSSLFRTNFSLEKYVGILRILSLSILLILVSFLAYSQSFFGAASVPTTDPGAQAGNTPPSVTPPVGMLAGDLVIIYGQYRGGGTITINQAGGQTWNT